MLLDRGELSEKEITEETSQIQDEQERKKLRDVELKVMRFIDKLEQKGGNKTGLNIQKEASKFRRQLLQVIINFREKRFSRNLKNYLSVPALNFDFTKYFKE